MGGFFRILFIIFALCLDMVLSGYFGESLILPNITLMLIVAWTLLIGFTESIGWILLAGICSDLLLFYPLGFSVLLFTLIGYGSSFLFRQFFTGHPFWMMISFLSIVLFSMGIEAISLLVFWGIQEGSALILYWILHTSLLVLVISFLFNVIFFLLCYKMLKHFEDFFSYYKRKVHPKRYV